MSRFTETTDSVPIDTQTSISQKTMSAYVFLFYYGGICPVVWIYPIVKWGFTRPSSLGLTFAAGRLILLCCYCWQGNHFGKKKKPWPQLPQFRPLWRQRLTWPYVCPSLSWWPQLCWWPAPATLSTWWSCSIRNNNATSNEPVSFPNSSSSSAATPRNALAPSVYFR